MEIRVGGKIKDNDPRMGNRVLTIINVLPYGVVAKDIMGRVFTYLTKRVYTDGKPRKSGMSVIE